MYSAVVQEIVDNGRRMSCTYNPTWTNASSFVSSSQNDGQYFPNGIISSAYTNTTTGFNTSTLTWRNAKIYLESLTSGYYGSNKPMDTDTPEQLKTKYSAIAQGLNAEYCHYMNRYKSVLALLLNSLTGSLDATTQRNMLQHTIEMNMRLNALTSLIQAIANQETAKMQGYSVEINELDKAIGSKTSDLAATNEFIQNSDSLLTTRKEMIRYTAEKNNHITNQISMWAALNVLAIGTIFAIYRNM